MTPWPSTLQKTTALEARRAVFTRGPLPCYPPEMRPLARATPSRYWWTVARSGPTLTAATRGRGGELTDNPVAQPDVYRMIRRRAAAAGIRTKIGNHTFRATGITEYLRNGGKLEIAQQMANQESARATGLYDRRDDQVSLDEVERILI